ncbi:hypothetical protein [Candidatus Stoquefichus massiliensis]|uniref:hypothetical protein n=1 Tax=Candidatus Stoquefichus massiliensis TaxID=1470350 RepID=UPI00048010F8|nr:hypothetical protein [Candidatus Stoquefichus massiliensis]
MCQKNGKQNYYIELGLLLSTGTYFLYDAQLISHELRFISLIVAVGIMIYGLFKPKNRCKN